MFSRIGYAFRETWQSFQRNVTLSVASVLTAAVSLLLAGMSFLIQKAFDQVLANWRDNVQFIVFMNSNASPDQIEAVKATLAEQQNAGLVREAPFFSKEQSFAEFNKLFATNPTIRDTLKLEDMPTQFKVKPVTEDATVVDNLILQFRDRPGVYAVKSQEDYVRVISRLSGFVRWVTTSLWVVLLATAIGLIWNTIRTAMFARRREIEVMKLVGATNWFIRVPFMLEGLLQGLIGALIAGAALLGINQVWTSRITSVTKGLDNTNDLALVYFIVDGSYARTVTFGLIILGMIAGAVGAGIAASRFLDV
jgi:cell division transport system permease protein